MTAGGISKLGTTFTTGDYGVGNCVLGQRFHTTADTVVATIDYYPQSPSGVPSAVGIYDRTAEATAYVATAPDGAIDAAGWWRHTLPVPMSVLASHNYTVMVGVPSGTLRPYNRNWVESRAPFVWDDDNGRNGYIWTGSATIRADDGTGGNADGASVGVTSTATGTGGTGAPALDATTLDAGLAEWLSSDGTTQQHETDGLPWLDHAILASDTFGLAVLKTAVDAIKAKTDALPASVNAVIGAVLDTLVADATAAAADRAAMIGRLDSAGGGSGFGTVVDDVLGPLAPVIAAYATPAPSTWVSQGVTDFDTNASVIVPADAYTVTFTDLGTAGANLTIGTQDVAYRLAWWAISDGERARERRFVDFPLSVVWDEGRRMPGMVLHSPAGGSGTVEAWLLE